MSDDITLYAWLEAQPLNTPIKIGDERVYLNVKESGAELGAYLLDRHTPNQLREALQQGFSSAIEFDAGLGQSEDGNDLVLTQWLPGIFTWQQAREQLERLLNQLSMWRTILDPAPVPALPAMHNRNRGEERLRQMFAKTRA